MAVIFITGITGFVGKNLLPMLLDAGYKVKALVRSNKSLPELPTEVEIIYGSIEEPETYQDKLNGTDMIINLAAAIFPNKLDSEALFYKVNVWGLKSLFNAGIASGVKKIVHLSTVNVLDRSSPMPLNDASPLTISKRLYDKTKKEGEQIALSYSDKVDVIILRPVLIYGAGDLFFLPRVIAKIKKRQMFFIGSQEIHAPFIHVLNVCDAILLAISKPHITGETFLLSDGQLTWKNLFDKISKELQLPIVEVTIPYRIAHVMGFLSEKMGKLLHHVSVFNRSAVELLGIDVLVDTSKARDILGYFPKVSLEEGWSTLLASFKKNDSPKHVHD